MRYAAGLALLIAATLPVRPAAGAEGAMAVTVTNFPEVQEVTGGVAVTRPIPQTRLLQLKALVAPGAPNDPDQLTDAGAIDAEGFATATLSLVGSLRGTAQPGAVGLILLPDVPEVLSAWQSERVLQLAIRIDAAIAPAEKGLFDSEPTAIRFAFPRYRVFLFNTTGRAADTTLFVYLGGS